MTDDDQFKALGQVIANSFFAMEAGESPEAGGYPIPEVNAGHMQLAHDLFIAGYRPTEIEWVDSIRHDDRYEYTISADCDGTIVAYLRREAPRFIIGGGYSDWVVTDQESYEAAK